MNWWERPLVGFDTETTGVDPFRDRIVTAAVVVTEGERSELVEAGGKVTRLLFSMSPGIPVPESAAKVHGVTDEIAETWQPASEVLPLVAGALISRGRNYPVVGHNVRYDLTILAANLARIGRYDLAGQVDSLPWVIDTLVLDKLVDGRRRKSVAGRKLTELAEMHGVELTSAHDSQADAVAACHVARRMGSLYAPLQRSINALHRLQEIAARGQASNWAEFAESVGRPVNDEDRFWPILPPPPGWNPGQLPQHEEKNDE